MTASAPLPTVLAALADELRVSSAHAVALEGLVSEMVRRSSGEDRKLAMQEAQGLDALQQHLDVLARFVARLADSAPEAAIPVGPALHDVPLAQLAARLRSALLPHGQALSAEGEAGDLELF
ncbi:MAG TPA: hypothetical protein VEA15_02935 [Caulobacteraceae bacterium]|nr:hypothetical protein [Caulobacteraceae bacterium]